jgi:hypothetical protein
MIKVTRIAGESYNLETRQEMPKALILSNGKREFAVYVGDDVAEAVLEMMLDSEAPARAGKPRVEEPTLERPVMPPQLAKPAPKTPPARVHTFEKPPPMAEIGDAPEPEEEDDNSGSEPGEEYNDPATGAGSL